MSGGRRREDPDYGVGEHTIDLAEVGLLSAEELTRKLVAAFESPGYRPPRLPAVATQLLALSRNPDVEYDEIERLLEQDPVLAGEVLSLARSAFYSRTHQVSGLRGALVLLGLRKLGQVVMQAAMELKVFRSNAYQASMDRLKEHCRATAHLAAIVSRYTPLDEEQAFLCGLLHDVGIAGILVVLGQVERGAEPPALADLWPAIDGAHAAAGARMIELWGLPAELALPVGAHHQVRVDGFAHPLAATLALAESLSQEFGRGLTLADGDSDAALIAQGLGSRATVDRSNAETLACAADALSVTEQTLDLVRRDAEKWIGEELGASAS